MKRALTATLLMVLAVISRAEKAQRIEDDQTAVKIGVTALVAKFGKQEVDRRGPFRARLVKQEGRAPVWVIEGAMRVPPDTPFLGGSMSAIIRQDDGRVIEVISWK